MRNLIPSLLSLLLLAPALAQQPEAELAEIEEEEIRRYTVEVIVFRYAQEVSTGSEVFMPDEPEPEPEPLLEEPVEFIQVLPPEPVEEEEPEPLPDTEFALLAEEDYELVDIIDRMEDLDVYEPVMHFGWTQATWPKEQTEAIPLARFAEPPEGLDGTMTLYLSRYLHLVVDLALQAPETPEPTALHRDGVEPQSDVRTVGDLLDFIDGENREPLPTYFRIQEDRILRNEELRYYDHPKFGVLAKVSRVEAMDEDASSDGELLGYGTE